MENAHAKSTGECLTYFGVSEATGLSPEQCKKNQEKYGFNGERSGASGSGGGGGGGRMGRGHVEKVHTIFAGAVCGVHTELRDARWVDFCTWRLFRRESQQLVETQRH